MNAVKAVGVNVVRKTARAADSRDHDELLLGDAQRGQDLLELGQDRIVTTAGTPAKFLVAGEVFGCQDGKFGGHRRVARLQSGEHSAGSRNECRVDPVTAGTGWPRSVR